MSSIPRSIYRLDTYKNILEAAEVLEIDLPNFQSMHAQNLFGDDNNDDDVDLCS